MKTKLYLFTTLMFLTLVIWAQDEPKFHEMFIQEWIDNNWEDTLKTTNTYDTSGNLIKSTSEVKNQETDVWENAIVMDYTLN
ncbi:MAG: hypothetical protein H7X84_05140, partial [Verrucomicrobia bacterium]|nr:hypothetical protein [Prolixibacteraceae bacterium]